MADLETFRTEARLWLRANAPQSLYGTREGRFDGFWGGRRSTETDPDILRWRDVMADKGWTAPTWPVEYGGGGLSRDEAKVLDEVMTELELPPAVVGFGLVMIGPTLLDYGTDAQKAEHLPKIARGETRWCQGYSEPGAGSDLASLQTRAVADGDDFIINGQKVWTSHADKSDWIFALVRTDPDAPKRKGITFILVDMDTPGVSTRPIELISGSSIFCETFFEDARVPARHVVGEVNNGWTVAKALLGYERTMIGAAISGQMLGVEDELIEQARHYLGCPEGRLPDPMLRDDIVRAAMNDQCLNLTVERIRQSLREGQAPGSESSILKVAGTEAKQARWELAIRIAGQQALGWEGPGYTDDELQRTRNWLRSRASTIEGGSSEIQLNVIASRVLGLKFPGT